MKRLSLAVAFLATGIVVTSRAEDRKVDFSKDIQPILAANCYKCHGPDQQEAGLRWDRKAEALKGGEKGTPIVAGKPAESLLYRAVNGGGEDVPRMPKKGDPLSSEQIALIRAWIEQGAIWPDVSTEENRVKEHWAFKAPVRPALPDVKNKEWIRTPIDAFVLARLEEEGLKPSPEADAVTLLRRASLDLIGLPPQVE